MGKTRTALLDWLFAPSLDKEVIRVSGVLLMDSSTPLEALGEGETSNSRAMTDGRYAGDLSFAIESGENRDSGIQDLPTFCRKIELQMH